MYYTTLDTPVNTLLIAGNEYGLHSISFHHDVVRWQAPDHWQESRDFFTDTLEQLSAYFKGQLTQFNLKLSPQGTTFQKKVWQALLTIDYGQTISYKELAQRIGNPNAMRAVGNANGKNPLSIVIPCHRVIGINGKLVGFGGGLETKQTLLSLEKSNQEKSSTEKNTAAICE